MAFTYVIRRAASGVIPSSIRATGSQRSCSTLFSTSAPITRTAVLSRNIFRSSFSTAMQQPDSRKGTRHATTRCDQSLVKVIDSQIHCAKESDDNVKVEDVPVPETFPFKIVDNPGKQTVTLTRDDPGERITVEVHIPDLITGDEDKNDDVNGSETESQLFMVVRVSKNAGPCLEFGVAAYPDKIEIETLSSKDPNGEDGTAYGGPDFGDLDKNLQKAFYRFLYVRGINPRSTNFLHEYMTKKQTKEYVGWLKKVKKFVEAYANTDDNKTNSLHGKKKDEGWFKKFVEACSKNDDDNKNNVVVGDNSEANANKDDKKVGDNSEANANKDDKKTSVPASDNLKAWTAHKAEVVYYYNAITGQTTSENPLGSKAGTASENLEAWTAHKKEVQYYHNALTGKSTFDKPVGFRQELTMSNLFSEISKSVGKFLKD